jgi:hypothetical protein
MKIPNRISLAASVTAGVLLLSGCVVAPSPYYTAGSPYAAGSPAYPATNADYTDAPVYAPTAPPAPYVEVQPAVPFVGAIWIGGFWNWGGGRYSWVPGRYERPRPGYRWEPRRWDHSPRGGWQMQGGWRR